MRALLTYVITATLLAASLVLVAAAPSHASPGNHRPATWNMQGASSSSDSKWTNTVARMAAGGSNYVEHDVIALQESGPRTSLPGTVIDTGILTDYGSRHTYYLYEVRRWRIGTATRGTTVYVTWLDTDPTGNRNNVAFVTHERPTNVTLVSAPQADNRNMGMRPALGIQLADGSRFWSFHASSNGDNRSNDAQNMLTEIQRASSPGLWAVLGDFNRRPENLTAPPGSQIYSSGQGTQQSGGELDYMVSNDQQNMQGWTGRRLNGAGSDHYPVEFAFRAASSKYKVSSVDHPGRCLVTRDWSWVTMEKCEQDLNWFYYSDIGHDLRNAGFPRQVSWFTGGQTCIFFPEPEKNPAHAWIRACDQWDEKYRKIEVKDDGRIIHSASGYCLDTSADWGNQLRLWWCDDVTYPGNQNFVLTGRFPYVWNSIWRFGPETGTEDAETGLSDRTADPSPCQHPPNPSLEPCHHISKRDTHGHFENGTDVPILDNNESHSPITVSGMTGKAPADLSVAVDIEHMRRGDLEVSLESPTRRRYLLESISLQDNGYHVYKAYTVNASAEDANGTWKLVVHDRQAPNTGKIDSWSLVFD
ncbi:proprotein convertase P-domain-containing protein [Streptomyces sp. NBC_01216]|uniref:proprotein convertase P-domain-containing protein n=1 Tax=Streptomyces sp. NBC_01216 TaxID=2903778 RepID=UPI002E0DC5E8|nr:proprotein convertase P-domain-containing protein [Streptomyces sp. NBC_01216]